MNKRAINNMILGAGSLLDIYGVSSGQSDLLDTQSHLPDHSDTEALRKDWHKVGVDISVAIGHVSPKLTP